MPGKYTKITFAIISAITIIFAVSVAWAEREKSIQTEQLRLTFNTESSTPIQWDVKIRDTFNKQQWKSLLTKDQLGRLLSRHLSLDGIEIKQECLEIAQEHDEIIYKATSADGRLSVRKIIKTSDDYHLTLKVEFANASKERVALDHVVRLVLGPGLGEYPVKGFGIAGTLYSFVGPAASIEGAIVGRNKVFTSTASTSKHIDWFGLHSRYFAILLSPLGGYAYNQSDIHLAYPTDVNEIEFPARYLPHMSIDLHVESLNPGQVMQREFLIFAGPKSTEALRHDTADFSGIIFFGIWSWMAALCSGIVWILKIINGFVSSWGIAIILLAVLVRIVMYPFTRKVLSSQKAFAEIQKNIQSEMSEIKIKYRGGEQSEKILELYKKHGISPFAGLKPLLIVLVQLPIFVALFHVLGRAFELRSASFLWIETLAEPDRLFSMGINLPFFGEYFNLLPILMATTTLWTIKLSPAPAADKPGMLWQNVFLTVVAIAFFMLFYSFPSGMVLYWTMANLLHLLQQLALDKMPRPNRSGH